MNIFFVVIAVGIYKKFDIVIIFKKLRYLISKFVIYLYV